MFRSMTRCSMRLGGSGARIVTHAAGDAFAFGDVAVRVLAPDRDYRPGSSFGE